MPARFQVSPAAFPADLDDLLAHRGYDVEAPVDILVGGPAAGDEPGPSRQSVPVATGTTVDDDWVRAYGDLHGDDAVTKARVEAYGRLMRTLGPPVVVATASLAGAPAGIGFGVVERGWTGIYGMGTRPDARRRGVASAVLHALARAGAAQSATRCYLQVEVDNDAAQSLYRRAGFTRRYGYQYRVKR
jgi:GNAT superfamily N-acetyltransferase